jgi:ubiquinone/menaquinone biosynthesis C-methylase UbiE
MTPKKGKFLDIGCGIGFFMSHLGKVRSDIKQYGTDYSAYNLKKAKKLPYEFTKSNIEEGLPYEDGTFHTVYAAELIEHLINPDFFFQESGRVLKKNGVLIVTTPNLVAWYNRILMLFGIMPMFYELSTTSPKVGSGLLKNIKKGKIPVGHIRIFTVRALRDLCEANGFSVETVKGAHFAALPKPVRWIDDIFKVYPRLASGIIIVARKK